MEFKKRVEEAFNQWKTNGECSQAKRLNEVMGTEYFDITNPHFFTGNLNAELVLIHLNPKRDKIDWNKKCTFDNFQSYWDFYENFGKQHYGINSKRTHTSKFDHKQIRFLKPFNILELSSQDKFQNLENVIDQKLQIELVPYGSPDFSFQKIGTNNLKPFIEQLQTLINESPRKYIIFCGRVFEHILNDVITSKTTHSFKMVKKDGELTKSNYQVINISIQTKNGSMKACIAPQFAQQGCPVDKYGEKVSELYDLRD